MKNSILVLNAGSSSIKFAVYRQNKTLLSLVHGQIEGIGNNGRMSAKDATGKVLADQEVDALNHTAALRLILTWLDKAIGHIRITAVGHRIVHGGDRFSEPVRLDANIIDALRDLIPLAPLHQPHNLAAVDALTTLRPGLPQIACFDTAFHCSQPWQAQRFALPRRYTQSGVKRYGFHGLSYEYIVRKLPQCLGDLAHGRVVVAHLGNGASMCAILAGKSIASTMGFTALDGLMMGTRCGNIDPGVLLYLLEHEQMKPKAMINLLYKESGLLGVSGLSSDMRTLLASSHPEAAEAVQLFVYRIARELGSLAAALGGIDALVFTGGIGEHAAPVREQVCRLAGWLGIEFDATANEANAARISGPNSRVPVLIVPTDEELMIAQHTVEVVTTGQAVLT